MTVGEFLGALSLVVRATLLVLVAVLLQITIATDLDVLGGRPDLVVIVVTSIALLCGPLAGAVAGFTGGFLVDALGLGVIGATSLTLTSVGYAAGLWGERLREAAAVRPLLAIGAASLAAGIGELGVAVLVGSGPAVSPGLVLAVVPGSMLNVLLAIGLYPLIRLCLRRRQPRTVLVDPESVTA
jgi:rod shape-determining protein MreD